MADRFCAYIRIGGRLAQTKLPELLKAISEAGVATEWGDAHFAPSDADELLSALRKGKLWLCDDQAACGEFPELEATCRALNLPYRRCSDGKYDWDAQITDWRPGMRKPLVRTGSNVRESTYVPADRVKAALKHLEVGRTGKAKKLLQALCPEIPNVAPFEIV